jgi:hypothetical protein
VKQTKSKYEFYQEASLSQQLSNQDEDFRDLAGCDLEISRSIAVLKVLGKRGVLDMNDSGVKLLMDLLDAQRKARFATSDTVHEITKMGLMMPKSVGDLDFDDEPK